ncbi:hypothetical protein CDAR_530631 [Caerostris darwini]|uniref:Uncharacterized protein n=1 Tax=Caerostris darwini TaxID=1538125 RepID=A0AAV4TDV8_9ARAC|nr:hypothetical protein CDAR_530631 [Caerostris darwini]
MNTKNSKVSRKDGPQSEERGILSLEGRLSTVALVRSSESRDEDRPLGDFVSHIEVQRPRPLVRQWGSYWRLFRNHCTKSEIMSCEMKVKETRRAMTSSANIRHCPHSSRK